MQKYILDANKGEVCLWSAAFIVLKVYILGLFILLLNYSDREPGEIRFMQTLQLPKNSVYRIFQEES